MPQAPLIPPSRICNKSQKGNRAETSTLRVNLCTRSTSNEQRPRNGISWGCGAEPGKDPVINRYTAQRGSIDGLDLPYGVSYDDKDRTGSPSTHSWLPGAVLPLPFRLSAFGVCHWIVDEIDIPNLNHYQWPLA